MSECEALRIASALNASPERAKENYMQAISTGPQVNVSSTGTVVRQFIAELDVVHLLSPLQGLVVFAP